MPSPQDTHRTSTENGREGTVRGLGKSEGGGGLGGVGDVGPEGGPGSLRQSCISSGISGINRGDHFNKHAKKGLEVQTESASNFLQENFILSEPRQGHGAALGLPSPAPPPQGNHCTPEPAQAARAFSPALSPPMSLPLTR